MLTLLNNYAFIDGNNVHMALKSSGWKLDDRRFRVYLKEHYGVLKAYYFIGYSEEHTMMYRRLQEAGYILIFKPMVRIPDGTMKGNVDAELVLQAMIDLPVYDRAVLVTGDGDFACLVRYLVEVGKFGNVLAPCLSRCSSLLKKASGKQIAFMDGLQAKLGYQPHK